LPAILRLLCVGAGGTALCACAGTGQSGDESWRSVWKDAPVTAQQVIEIRSVAGVRAIPRADQVSAPPVVAYGDGADSRLCGKTPEGPLHVSFDAALPDGLDPKFVLTAGGAILVEGTSRWALFSSDGAPRAAGVKAAGVLRLQPERNLCLAPNRSGTLTAFDLSDGSPKFDVALTFGAAYERRMIALANGVLRVASVERTLDPHAGIAPRQFLLEVRNLTDQRGEGLAAGEVLTEPIADLTGESRHFACALRRGQWTFAVDNAICRVDESCALTVQWNGAFEPRFLSVDEAGRMYLLARVERRMELWLVRSDGGRVYAAPISDDAGEPIAPPIVGYGHVAYVLTRSHAAAVDQTGELLWSCKPAGPVAGAGVTADDHLLIAAGGELGWIDPKGAWQTLYDFGPRSVRTPPVLTERGDVLLATDERLYALTTKPPE